MIEEFKEITPSDFFYRNRDIAGFTNPSRALYSTVRELVENSLDACEIHGILPDIYIRISPETDTASDPAVYRIRIQDNGSGLPAEVIPSAFGQVLFGSKYKLRQSVDYSERVLIRNRGTIETIEIGRFVDQFLKPEEDIKNIYSEVYETLAFDFERFKFSWSRISHVSRHIVNEPLYEVTLEGGRTITVTGAHSIFTLKDGKITLKEVARMRRGDYVVVPRFLPEMESGRTHINLIEMISYSEDSKHESLDSTVRPIERGILSKLPAVLPLSKDFIRFLGYLTAEREPFRSSVTINLGEHETALLGEVTEIVSRALKIEPHIEQTETNGGLRLILDGPVLTHTIKALGLEDDINSRGIPKLVFNVPTELRREFIEGMYRRGGYVIDEKDHIAFSTQSRKLAYDLIYLLMSIGVFPTVTELRGGKGKDNTIYTVKILGRNLEEALNVDAEGLAGNEGFKVLGRYPNFVFCRIVRVRRVKPSSPYAYDLSIPGKENFICGLGGICCHNTRGTFGLGGKMAVLYGQITTHGQTRIISSVGTSKIHEYVLMMDIQRNKPIVTKHRVHANKSRWHGTIVEFTTEADYSRAMPKILEYLKETAIVVPYANLTFVDPKGRLYRFDRATNTMPKPPSETTPHPHGIDIETLKRMIEATDSKTMKDFMKKHFQRVGEKIARRFLEFADVSLKKSPKRLTQEEIVRLVNALKNYDGFLPPDASCLSPLGKELLRTGIRKELNPEFVAVHQRKPAAYSGFPFIVEVGVAYGGGIPKTDGILLYRFANRIPLLFDEASDISYKVVNEMMNWRHYKVTPETPIAVFIHICSLKIPYKTVGKEFIADRPEVEHEVLNALREVARQLALFLSRKHHMERERRRLDVFSKYLPKIASFSAKLADKDKVPDVKKLLGSIARYVEE
ncbi:MAG: DNA topoisomerase VI subunit B [Candidatus Bathyarchaeia archaeon]